MLSLSETTVVNTQSNGLLLNLTLGINDFNLLKRFTDIANNENDTFIFLKSGSVTDMYGNDISEQGGMAVQASLVIPDRTNPVLDSFSLNVDTGVIVLTFSETVNASSLKVTDITLQSDLTNTSSYYQLTGGSGSTLNQPEVSINLTVEDLNAIKQIRDLTTRFNNTFISVTSNVISDMVNLILIEVPRNNALGLQPGAFTQDTTSPILQSFSLNLTSEELGLTFVETVSARDIVLSRIMIQSSDNGTSVSLTATSGVSENDSTVITIFLSTMDLNNLKLDVNLATSSDSTQLVLLPSAVRDMAFNPNMEQTLIEIDFYPDNVQPLLENYIFDLNTGLIRLYFDEVVNVSSLDIGA